MTIHGAASRAVELTEKQPMCESGIFQLDSSFLLGFRIW